MITDDPEARRLTRRSLLAGGGTLAMLAAGGCLGSDDGGEESSGGESRSSVTETETLVDHPAAADLGSQPTRGIDPTEADAVIIVFSDPSCPRCRAFERTTVPKIESELVRSGLASYVYRGYPVVYPWGEPATRALEATFARDIPAFWALAEEYYEQQPSFDESNVLDRTREFLSAETEIDADGVVSDVKSGAFDATVQVDLDAGMAAGAGRTTPHVFLFQDGTYRTKAAGSVSFSVIANALGL